MFFLKDLPSQNMIARYTGLGGDVARISAALTEMRRASEMIRKLERYFAGHGLSQLKFHVMIVIDREPEHDSLRQSDIAERIDVSKPVLHRTIGALVDAGLLCSAPDPTDGRAALLSLSESGSAKLAEILPGYFQTILTFDDAA